MAQPYSSEDEIEKVVVGFESCTTGKDDFSHRDHLAMAVWYLRSDQETAAARMRASLHRFLDKYGCRENYHETLTIFWLQLVRRELESLTPESSLLETTNTVVERLGNSQVAFKYYSKELVDSETAKKSWIEPDLRSLNRKS
jgi:hypothetical protein